MEARTLSVKDAAKLLGIGRNSAYEAVRRGEIPAIRIGRRCIVPRVALERLLGEIAASGDAGFPV
jgi:excisionase family DNA binding protein